MADKLLRSGATKEKKGGRKQKKDQARSVARNVAVARPRAPDGDGSVDRALFDRFEDYVGELYDPENASGKLGPSIFPHQGAARRKPFDITHTSASNNEVVLFKMYPRLDNTVMVSADGVVPAPSAANVLEVDFEETIAANTSIGGAGRPEVATGGEQGGDFELPLVRETVNGLLANSCACSVPAGSNVPFVHVNLGEQAAQCRLWVRDAVTAVWAGVGAGYYQLAAGQTASLTTGVIANGIDRFAVLYRNGSTSTRSIKFKTIINTRTVTPPVVMTYPASAYKSYAVLTDAQEIDEVMVRAMSMRLTCMGDLTTIGGRVACALVPREFVPDSADPVGSIAQLPTGAFDGKLMDGCHIMWQPREQQDFSFRPPEFDDRSHYLIIAVLLATAGTPIRLKASFNYEIFSLDPSLGSMAWCPSGFGLMEVLTAVFASVPPGSTNDAHLVKKKSALQAISALARKSLSWVMKNPAEAAAIAARTAAKGAAMLAVL